MNALFLVVWLAETVVAYTLGAALIAAGVVGVGTAVRTLVAAAPDGTVSGGALSIPRSGSGSVALPVVLLIGLVLIYAGMTLWMR